MENKIKLTSQVNKIVQMHLDRALGYQKARSLTADVSLKNRFEQCMQQSYSFADKLKAAMDLQGLSTKGNPSWYGTIFRTWMTVRVMLSHRKSHRLLHCCLVGEKMIDLNYDLLCSNKYLDFNYPLLKYTFLKQHFSLKNTREDLEAYIELLAPAAPDFIEAKSSYSTVNSLAGNSSNS